MRRLAHGDAPGPRGTPGPPGRPCELSERHHVDAPDPSTGCRRARPLGPARPPGVQRLPADRHLSDRFRPVHGHRGAQARRSDLARLRSPAHRARQVAGGHGGRVRCRAAREVHGLGGAHRGRHRDRHPRSCKGRRASHRAGQAGGRGGRAALVRGQGRAGGDLSRAADPGGQLLRVLAGPAGRRLRGLHPVRAVLGGLPHPRRPHCVIAGWPRREFDANRGDVEGNYLRMFEMAPSFAERIRGATRESRFVGTGDLPNFFRTPYGPGWALVGDAGYHKDPLTAQGISDAFRDAELLAVGLDRWLAGGSPFEDEMADYQRARDVTALPMFELTCQLASMEPPPPAMLELLAALPGNQEAMTAFVSVIAGTVPAPEFFAPANVQRIMAAAGSATTEG